MARIVLELTNRCNLACDHCFAGRHGGQDDLPLAIITRVLGEGRRVGFDELAFTGGEPTVHPQFPEIIRQTAAAGYRFGMVTNGWNFSARYSSILRYREQLTAITFSLDGATEATHDQLRGAGSFRRVLQAISICVFREIPFTINMVVTTHNRHEVARMADLAVRLRSRGLRYGHLMPARNTTARGFDLSPAERQRVEAEIRALRESSSLPLAMAPGYHTPSLFPCAPLQGRELNIDCRGNLTKCCHLSGHGPGVGEEDVVASLTETSFTAAWEALVSENRQFRAAKLARLAAHQLQDTDYFPCWYCSLHYRKVDWLHNFPRSPWSAAVSHALPERTGAGTSRPEREGE